MTFRLPFGIADRVDTITLERFRAVDLRVQTKPGHDSSHRRRSGRRAYIRDLLRQFRPATKRHREEEDSVEGLSGRRWIIDPIDGTKNYVRGVPVWATSLRFVMKAKLNGIVRLPRSSSAGTRPRTWVHLPAGRRRPRGAFTCPRWGASQMPLCLTRFPDGPSVTSCGVSLPGNELWRMRAYGDFWSYMLVAEGAVDIATRARAQSIRHGGPRADCHRGRCALTPRRRGRPVGRNATKNHFLHDEALGILARSAISTRPDRLRRRRKNLSEGRYLTA